ncbi:MAG TPA: hypothetical protein VGJ92_05040 [Methanocella sp.]|jgi:hypothetical protein
MTAKKSIIFLIAASILAAILFAGCTSPTPTPVITPSPTVPPAISPVPTPIGGSDTATIDFSYTLRQYTQMYEGIPVYPGEIMYGFDVTVDSDKPVETDQSWFTIEYRRNASAPLETFQPMAVRDYPSTTIGNGSKPATGRVLIVLPAPTFGSFDPVPIYFKPLDQQTGPYKVLNPVRGYIRT